MGYSDEETQWLIAQSQLYDGITRHCLHRAGLTEGMKVLDIGSGAGDVAFTAAQIVGSTGQVMGVCLDPTILETARARAEAMGHANVEFMAGNIVELELDSDFDMVVGRLILASVPQPAQLVRTLATHVKPGGVVAFQEFELQSYHSMKHPETPLVNKLIDLGLGVIEHSGASNTLGFDLFGIVTNAGLPAPDLHFEAPMGGADTWPGFQYLATTFKSMLPLLVEFGLATAEELDLDTLPERVSKEVSAVKRPLVLPPHVTAYSRLPG